MPASLRFSIFSSQVLLPNPLGSIFGSFRAMGAPPGVSWELLGQAHGPPLLAHNMLKEWRSSPQSAFWSPRKVPKTPNRPKEGFKRTPRDYQNILKSFQIWSCFLSTYPVLKSIGGTREASKITITILLLFLLLTPSWIDSLKFYFSIFIFCFTYWNIAKISIYHIISSNKDIFFKKLNIFFKQRFII